MTLTTNPRPLGFVMIGGHEFAVRIDDPRPGRAPSSRPTLPAAPDAGPETSSGAAGTS